MHNMHLYIKNKVLKKTRLLCALISTGGAYLSMCHYKAYYSSTIPSTTPTSHLNTMKSLVL